MEENVTKESILMLIRAESDAFQKTVSRIDRGSLSTPGVEGDWSVKDILAHLAAWRRLFVRWTHDLLEGKSPDRPAPGDSWDDLDEYNHSLYLQQRTVPLDEALEEYASAHRESVALVESLSEADLLDPDRFPWRRGDPLWHMVAGNTWVHDREHNDSIQRWLAAREG